MDNKRYPNIFSSKTQEEDKPLINVPVNIFPLSY